MSETPFIPATRVEPTLTEATQPLLPPLVGVTVPDDYEALEKLGEGGMGVVWKARQKSLNRIVALKMIKSGTHASTGERERFQIEAEAAARLQHPNVVRIYEVGACPTGTGGTSPYMVLEYVEGGSLAGRLTEAPLSPNEAAALTEALARAIQAAHEVGIVHRDLKPANVLLASGGRQSPGGEIPGDFRPPLAIAKITDFGLAKRLDIEGDTHSGAILGTPTYMAPEQARGDVRAVGPRADVYALGAILYECLTGRPPFRAPSSLETLEQVRTQEPVAVRRLTPRCPRDLETIALKCLEKDPQKRYESAAALADDLQHFLAGEPIKARPVGAVGRLWRWCQRKPHLAALSAALILVTLGGIAGIWLEYRHAERRRIQAEERFRIALESSLSIGQLANELEPLVGTRRETIAKILELAASNYQRLSDSAGATTEVREGKAKMLTSSAALYRGINRSQTALATATEAVALWDELLQEADTEARRTLRAQALLELARVQWVRGDAVAAVTARTAVEERRRLLAAAPKDPQRKTDLIKSLMFLANSLRNQGESDEPKQLESELDALADELARQRPEKVNWQLSYIQSRRRRGDDLYYAGKYEDTLQAYRQLLKDCTAFVEAAPDVNLLRGELARAHSYVGWALQALGRGPEARAAFQAAIAVATPFAQNDKRDQYWQSALLEYTLKEADVVDGEQLDHAALKRLLQTRVAILESQLASARQTASEDPDNVVLARAVVERRYERAMAKNALGFLRIDADRNLSEAETELRELTGRCAELSRRDPASRIFAHDRANIHYQLGHGLTLSGRQREGTLELLTHARVWTEFWEQAVRRAPDKRSHRIDLAQWQRMQGIYLQRLATVEQNHDRAAEALTWLNRARAACERLLEEKPHDLPALEEMIATLQLTAGVLQATGRDAEAKAEQTRLAEWKKKRDAARPAQTAAPTPTYKQCSVWQLALHLVSQVEGLRLGRNVLDIVERQLEVEGTQQLQLEFVRQGLTQARELLALPLPETQAEARRLLRRCEVLLKRALPLSAEQQVWPEQVKVLLKRIGSEPLPMFRDEALRGLRDALNYLQLAATLRAGQRDEELVRFVALEWHEGDLPTWRVALVGEIGGMANYRAAIIKTARAMVRATPARLDAEEARRLAEWLYFVGEDEAARELAPTLPAPVMEGPLANRTRDVRSWVAFERRRFDAALSDGRAVLTARGATAFAWTRAGYSVVLSLCERGEFVQAESEARTLLKQVPQSPFTQLLLARVLAAQGTKLDEAEGLARAAVKVLPGESEFVRTLAWIETFKPEPQAALARFEKECRHETQVESPIVWDELGDVYRRLGMTEKARQAWQRALSQFPSTTVTNDWRKATIAKKLATR